MLCCYLLEAFYFLRERKGVDLDVSRGVEEVGRIERKGTVFRLRYMRKESMSNKRRKIKKILELSKTYTSAEHRIPWSPMMFLGSDLASTQHFICLSHVLIPRSFK